MKNPDFFNNKKVFIVAELSANHNGKLEVAIETVKAAARAGADAIKLQTYTADTMTINSAGKAFIIDNGSIRKGHASTQALQDVQAHNSSDVIKSFNNDLPSLHSLPCVSIPRPTS